MASVVDRDASGKVGFLRHAVAAAGARFGQVRGEIEIRILQRLVEKAFEKPVVFFVGHRQMLGIADTEDVEHKVVGACVDVGAENVDPRGEESAADPDDESGMIPAAEQDFAVSLLRMVHPFDHGAHAAGRFFGLDFEKFAEHAHVAGDFRRRERAEVAFRHVGEMRRGLFTVVGGEFAQDVVFESFEIDAAFFEVGRTLLEVGFGRAVKLPDEAFLPVRPTRVARALSIGQRDQHEGVEVFDGLDHIRKMRNGGGVFEVAGLGGFGEESVVVDEHDEGAALFGRKLQALGHPGGHHRAGFLVVAAVLGLPRVVHEEGEVECRGVVVFLEEIAVAGEFRVLAGDEVVQLVDADQRVLVGRVAVEKFVLHEAGEASEFREVASEKIRLVHHAQDAPDAAFAGEDGEEDLADGAGVLEGAVDELESPTDEIAEFGCEIESAHLRMLEEAHETWRVLAEDRR